MTDKRVPTSNYVTFYDPEKAHHRAWLQAVLDHVVELDPSALDRGNELHSIWAAAVETKAPNPYQMVEPLLSLIRQGEASNSYDAVNDGKAGGRRWQGLQKMTVKELMDAQGAGRVFAVGAYQVTPEPMKQLAQRAGLPVTIPFDQATQDWFAVVLVLGGWKRPKLTSYLLGGSATLREAHEDVAYEWAALQGPDGKGMYDGDSAGNKASIKAATVAGALMYCRERIGGRSVEQLGLKPPGATPPKPPPAPPKPEPKPSITLSAPFDTKLTPHITLGEFARFQEARRFRAKHQIETAIELAEFMEKARARFGGRPVIISSGYRPPAINKAVGGAVKSEHLYSVPGEGAVDFYIDGVSLAALQEWCDKNWPHSVGYGAHRGFVHVGRRANGERRRWNY